MRRAKLTTLAIVAALVVALVGVDRLAVGQEEADPVLVGAGDIASCRSTGDEATADLLAGIEGTVATFGDNAYQSGTSAEYSSCYNPSWGRFKARTMPSVGNHEYYTASASGYFGYFGEAAGDPQKGYYSYDLGSWHVVVLNSNCAAIGGCGAGSAQEQWLKDDLGAYSNQACTLAYFHHPRFSSSTSGNNSAMVPFWEALYEAGAEVVLNGHAHHYERFAPQTPGGQADPEGGISQFVVGTGGKSLNSFGTVQANSEVRLAEAFGVIKLTLHPEGYDWQFVAVDGTVDGETTDSGSGSCHSAPPKPPDRPGPLSVTSTDPGADETGVATTTNVTAFLSEEMMDSSINTKTFKLTKKGSSTKIGAVITYFPDDPATTDTVEARATLDPNNSLKSGVTYKAVVTTGAKDSEGNSLQQQYKWFFTVR
jgi:hypothetical protein